MGCRIPLQNLWNTVARQFLATRSPYFITYAKREKEAKEAAETLEAALGYPPEMICQMGASTVYGNGRAAVAVVFQSGKAE